MPNRPLLLLLVLQRAEGQGENRFCFPEIEADLREALVRFSPTEQVSPHLAFWHLQTDGCWVVEEAASIPLGKNGKRPNLTTLREMNACAKVQPSLWKELTDTPVLIRELAAQIIAKYLPSADRADVADFFRLRI